MSKKTKKSIKVRDLNPKKDAKGGGIKQQGAAPTGAAVTGAAPQGAAQTGIGKPAVN
jgi:hypothetical protein